MNKLTNEDWDLIKASLKYYDEDETNELLDKINLLDLDDYFDFKEELNLNTFYWHYVQLFPSAGMSKELDEDFFKDEILLVTDKSEGYDGIVYYGKLKNHNIYIKLDDHPGSSGYDCCGYIRLTYSDNKDILNDI
jgi:MoaA/NifB/PqqE/SkfB family radical SAM enzyme